MFLPSAIRFMQMFPDSNRFKHYRFVKFHNEIWEQLIKESDREFNKELIQVCEDYMQRGKNHSFTIRNIFEILEVAMDKCNTNSSALDIKKVQVEDALRRSFLPQKDLNK
jgi:hypothetical protein